MIDLAPKLSGIRGRVADGIALGGDCNICDRYAQANSDRRALMGMLNQAISLMQNFGNQMPGQWKADRSAFLAEVMK